MLNFPAFRKKNGEINSFQKRVQDCFLYSMNGVPPPLGSRELLAIEDSLAVQQAARDADRERQRAALAAQ